MIRLVSTRSTLSGTQRDWVVPPRRAAHHPDSSCPGLGVEPVDAARHQGLQLDLVVLQAHRPGVDAGQIEQVINQRAEEANLALKCV